ncbi:sorting and assembly machinery component 50 homolog A [Eurytemora carolleeae]|uniref:sorting and assembly machinery component 50 homolog A n=1 Tax=Eurytemora carolleeae TaxID=1294199 RepID=UPI000C77FF4B|nr:sorting and assembly machinery component 50 homolog A [Eurytemora carolleeae]|eukprot:XP_023342302.1 sorting and assembly machinery component 50 homolog A-like [Eurytemora affinis]
MNSVKDLFQVEHFEDLVLMSQEVRGKLQELGCFSKVGIHIDTSQTGVKDYVVTFNVEENKRIVGSVNTLVGNNEGSLMTGVKLLNVLGRGEKLQADYTYGTKKSSSFNISFLKPFFGAFKSNVTGNIYQAVGEHPGSGYKELDRGFLADLSFLSAPQVDVYRLTQEFAGLGGNIGFFKNELEVQANIPLGEDISIQGCLNAGILKPTQGDKTLTISDNFFLGGPLNVRGFDLRGIGPHSDGNALGGTLFWATGLHLYGPLPFRPGRGGFGDLFKTHMFMTAGNVGSFWLPGNMLLPFCTTGLGLAVKLGGIARIELNYCIPIKASRGDKVTPGLQFGVGVNFL